MNSEEVFSIFFLFYLESVYILPFCPMIVIPAKAGIQCFEGSLDAGSGPA
jgi:hypothetical protein